MNIIYVPVCRFCMHAYIWGVSLIYLRPLTVAGIMGFRIKWKFCVPVVNMWKGLCTFILIPVLFFPSCLLVLMSASLHRLKRSPRFYRLITCSWFYCPCKLMNLRNPGVIKTDDWRTVIPPRNWRPSRVHCISLGLCVLLVWLGWPGLLNCQRVHEHLARCAMIA